MNDARCRLRRTLVRSAFLAVLLSAPSRGRAHPVEPFLDISIGRSFPGGRDVRITQPGKSTDLVVHGVPFDDGSFEPPIWYRVRVGLFTSREAAAGVALEFVHEKLFARTSSVRRVEGTFRGAVIDSLQRIDRIVQSFAVSHGTNHLMLQGIARCPLAGRSHTYPSGRLQVLGGIGLGPVIAHAENVIGREPNRQRSQIAGLGFVGFAGLRTFVHPRFGFTGEYKFTRSNIRVDVAGGSARLRPRSHHLSAGLTYFPSE